jgi:hypothetical protein
MSEDESVMWHTDRATPAGKNIHFHTMLHGEPVYGHLNLYGPDREPRLGDFIRYLGKRHLIVKIDRGGDIINACPIAETHREKVVPRYLVNAYELAMLVHYYIYTDDYRDLESETGRRAIENLRRRHGLLELGNDKTKYKLSDKGRVFVEAALETPLPTQRWVVEK